MILLKYTHSFFNFKIKSKIFDTIHGGFPYIHFRTKQIRTLQHFP